MKRTLIACSALIIAALLVNIPDLAGETLLNSFNGGKHNLTIFQNSTLTSGIGPYEAAAGIGITTLRPTPASVYWNPAGLAFIKKGGMLIEAVPGFSYSPNLDADIKVETDNALADLDQNDSTVIIYPDFSFESGQQSRAISSFALAFPMKDFFFGLAYQNAYSLTLNLISAGVENQLTSIEANPDENADIFTRTDINMLLDLQADVLSLSAGRMIIDKLGAGLTLSKINANTNINGILAPEGVFVYTVREVEHSFNDPSAGYQNDLYSSMIGNFEGEGWGAKFGLSYHLFENLSFDFMYSMNPDLTLNGNMEIIQYFYPALNLNADKDAGEEMFNITDLDVTKPVKTVYAANQPDDKLHLKIPSSVSIGSAYSGISLSLTKYLGELSYSFDLARDSIMATYSRGFKPNMGFLLGFDLKYVQLSFGGIIGDEIITGYKDDNGIPEEPMADLILPRFNLGTGFIINENWKMDILFFNMPDLFGSVLKVGATYSF